MRSSVSKSLPHAVVLGALLASGPIAAPVSPAIAASDRLIDAASREPWLHVFVDLIKKAAIADQFDAKPFTIFMPSDGAFKRLPAKQRDAILSLSPELTRQFVEHYVVPGVALKSSDMEKTLTTSDGTSFEVAWAPGRLTLRDITGAAPGKTARVFYGDTPAGSGRINAIDTVLIPRKLEAAIIDGQSGDKATSSSGNVPPTSPADTKAGSLPAQPEASPAPPPASSPSTETTPAPAPPPASSPSTETTPAPAPPPASPAIAETTPAPGPQAAPPEPPPANASSPASSPATAPPPPPPVVQAPQPLPAAPSSPAPSAAPPSASAPQPSAAQPEVSIAVKDLRGWKVQLSDSSKTGSVDRVVIGLKSGRVLGIAAKFGAFLGFGGKTAFIPWDRLTVEPAQSVLKAKMTTDEMKAAPSKPDL